MKNEEIILRKKLERLKEKIKLIEELIKHDVYTLDDIQIESVLEKNNENRISEE